MTEINPGTDAQSGPFDPAPAAPVDTPSTHAQPVRPIVRPRRSGAFLNLLLGVGVIIAASGLAFAAGRVTAPASAAGNGATNRGGFGNGGALPSGAPGNGFPGGNGGPGGFGRGAIVGTVTAISADSITITTANGQSMTIAIGASTAFHGQTAASASAVTTGGQVIIQLGTQGSTGAQASPGASAGTAARSGSTASSITVIAP